MGIQGGEGRIPPGGDSGAETCRSEGVSRAKMGRRGPGQGNIGQRPRVALSSACSRNSKKALVAGASVSPIQGECLGDEVRDMRGAILHGELVALTSDTMSRMQLGQCVD